MTSVSQIKVWFDEGLKDGATHMIVKWDSFDGPEGDYPVYVYPGEDARKVADKNNDSTVECYSYAISWEYQATERRAFHWE